MQLSQVSTDSYGPKKVHRPSSGVRSLVLVAAAVCILLTMYVLCLKPACWLMVHHYISLETYRFVYTPLFKLGEIWPAVAEFIRLYLQDIDSESYWE